MIPEEQALRAASEALEDLAYGDTQGGAEVTVARVMERYAAEKQREVLDLAMERLKESGFARAQLAAIRASIK